MNGFTIDLKPMVGLPIGPTRMHRVQGPLISPADNAFRTTRPLQEGISVDCPVCKSVKLVMTDRQGIEIDYCPSCRGIWLDRGELDKLIERAVQQERGSLAAPAYVQEPSRGHGDSRSFKDSGHGHHKEYGHGPQDQRRRSFWRDLFD
jgi:Zn-finger nucleic acid-binding protein